MQSTSIAAYANYFHYEGFAVLHSPVESLKSVAVAGGMVGFWSQRGAKTGARE